MLLHNLYDFITTCFWHYCIVLEAALIWFVVSGGRKNKLLNWFVVFFLFTFAVRMIIHLDSSRYLFNSVLFALPVIGFAGVALFDRCRRSRIGTCLFILLILLGVTCSFLKTARKSRNPRDRMILQSARFARKDFLAAGEKEALFVSNGNNIGMIFAYADIPGKFYTIGFSPNAPQKFQSTLQLLCSQYPLVYFLKEQRYHKKDSGEGIFECAPVEGHSYHSARIDDGKLDPRGKYGKFELHRIASKCAADYEKSRIAEFLQAPQRILNNGDFSCWDAEKHLPPCPELGDRFPAAQLTQRLPAGWTIDLSNRRGGDFSKWSFRGEPPTSDGGKGRCRFEASGGGLSLKSLQQIPVGDYDLTLSVDATDGGKLLAILYVHERSQHLTTQFAGVWQSGKTGRALVKIPIRKSSFPSGAATFQIGVIGWQGNFSLDKIDLLEPRPGNLK